MDNGKLMKEQNPFTLVFYQWLYFSSILVPFIMLGSMCTIHLYLYLIYSAIHLLINSILYAILLMLIHLLNLNRVIHLYKIRFYKQQSLQLRNKKSAYKTVKIKINWKLILRWIGQNDFIVKYVNSNAPTGPDTVISARYVFLDMTITVFGLEIV